MTTANTPGPDVVSLVRELQQYEKETRGTVIGAADFRIRAAEAFVAVATHLLAQEERIRVAREALEMGKEMAKDIKDYTEGEGGEVNTLGWQLENACDKALALLSSPS